VRIVSLAHDQSRLPSLAYQEYKCQPKIPHQAWEPHTVGWGRGPADPAAALGSLHIWTLPLPPQGSVSHRPPGRARRSP